MIRDTLLVIDDSELDLAILNEIFKHHRNADGSGWPQDMDGEAPLSAMLVHTALRLQHYLHYYQGYEDALDRAVRTMKGEVGSILTEEMAGLLEETRQLRAALL